jgi:tetratricopeptide (TPR) repeat protein
MNTTIYKILFFVIFSITNLAAQNNSLALKRIWENTQNADSIRFNALAEYYILNNQAQPDSTLKVLDYYYQLAKEKRNDKELYNVANDRGGIYRLKGDLDTSMSYYLEAQKYAIKLNDPILRATNLGNIGNVYANKRDYRSALDYFSNSFKIYKNLNDKKGESRMLSSIGNVYLYIENYDLALEYYQNALSTIENVDVPPRSVAVIYLNIGWTNYELKNYSESKIYYDKSLKILEVTNDKFFLVSGYSTLARIHFDLSEFQLATDYAKKSLTLSKELNVPEFITTSEIILAQIDLKKDNIKAAQLIGESILANLDKDSSLEIKRNLYDLLYKCYEAEGNPKKSLEMYKKYTIYRDSIQLDKNEISLIREVIEMEFENVLQEKELTMKREKAELEFAQLKKTSGIILGSIIFIMFVLLYFNRRIEANKKRRDELLQEIEKLKTIDTTSLVVNSNEYKLSREKIELFINRKLNDTDWNVLNILQNEPDISNKELSEKTFMSVDGIGSSLRRMYLYFDIRESKYKKISLIMEAIKASSK